MKECKKCGATTPNDNQLVCYNCGAEFEVPKSAEPENKGFHMPTNVPGSMPMNSTGLYNPVTYMPQKPMNWYGFLIYFLLWVSAIGNVIYGLLYLSGSIYSMQGVLGSEIVYGIFGDGLRSLDMIYGVVMIIIAVYSIYVRMQLAGYKIGAPGKLVGFYIFSGVAGIIYQLIVISITSSRIGTASSIGSNIFGSVVGTLIMVFANKSYFDKRAHLFTK